MTMTTMLDIKSSIEKTGSEKICKKLFELLAETLPEDQKKLISAVHSKQIDMARSIIHKMHGGLTYCQAPEYTRQILHIRELLCQNKVDEATAQIPLLQQTAMQLLESIREYCIND